MNSNIISPKSSIKSTDNQMFTSKSELENKRIASDQHESSPKRIKLDHHAYNNNNNNTIDNLLNSIQQLSVSAIPKIADRNGNHINIQSESNITGDESLQLINRFKSINLQ